jgi:hypothetical protein
VGSNHRDENGRLKMLYHIDGSVLRVVKYAIAHINKYMEAKVRSYEIGIKVVVFGPDLKLFAQ